MKEIWKEIPGYNGFYEASTIGRVRSYRNRGNQHTNGGTLRADDPRIMSACIGGKGYRRVRLTKNKKSKSMKVSRLVAKTFIPNPENKPCVNHIDGNKKNDSLSNLEWNTYSENAIHAFKNGLSKISDSHKRSLSEANRGEGSGTSKLTEVDVMDIRSVWPTGWFTQQEIAEAYGVRASAISRLINYKTWSHA